jgi:hypothetical protein
MAALPACSPDPPTPAGEMIACALDGAADFAEVCVLERDGLRFLIRRPDGGFRRFEPLEGRGIRSIDGADAAILVPLADGMTEIAVERDRYRVRVARPSEPIAQDDVR